MKFADYHRLHLDFYRTLFLQLTLKCPLECDHCCVGAGPSQESSLTADAVEAGIRSFVGLPSAELVCLTGGEPFSVRSVLRRALAVCEEVGLKSYVITSANWAQSEASAERVLGALARISLLSISADRFHEKFVPLDYLQYAAIAARAKGIPVSVLLSLEEGDEEYETKVRDVFREVDGLEFNVTTVQPVGRAIERGVGVYPIQSAPVPMEPCPMLGTPAITASGAICACCQAQETNHIQSGLPNALRLGTLGQTSLEVVRAQVQQDPLLRALRFFGPGWVFHRAQERGMDLGGRQTFKSICDVCSNLVRNTERASQLRNMLIEPTLKLQIDVAATLHEAARAPE